MTVHKIRDDVLSIKDRHHRYNVRFLRYIDNDAHVVDDAEIQHIRRNGKPGRFISIQGQRGSEILAHAKRLQDRRTNHRSSPHKHQPHDHH